LNARNQNDRRENSPMESLDRQVERLFSDTMRHPLLFWSHWEHFVIRHHLDPKQADALLWNRTPPQRLVPAVAQTFTARP